MGQDNNVKIFPAGWASGRSATQGRGPDPYIADIRDRALTDTYVAACSSYESRATQLPVGLGCIVELEPTMAHHLQTGALET